MKRKSEGGTAALEFALILPLFLILIFGVVEFGLILYYKGLITHSSREGARWGALYTAPRRTNAEVQTYVGNFLNSVNLTGATITVSGAGGAQGTPLSVKVDYPYQYVILSQLIGLFAGPLTLSAETVMLLE